jgi:hypothetical protein
MRRRLTGKLPAKLPLPARLPFKFPASLAKFAQFEQLGNFYDTVHLATSLVLPLVVLVLVRVDFASLALAVIIISKWRTLAVRPRYWLANVRANGVDVMVGLSALVFIINSPNLVWQIIWAAGYAAWLVLLKPRADRLSIAAQALVGQVAGLLALFLYLAAAPTYALVILSALVCYLAAHHFFNAFDEGYTNLLSYFWGYFAAALAWVLGHWLVFYGPIAQPALILTVISAGLGTVYYLDHYERLSLTLKRELVLVMVAALVIILVFSDWGDKIV